MILKELSKNMIENLSKKNFELKEDEFFVKERLEDKTVFFTKFNQTNGKIPKTFLKWGEGEGVLNFKTKYYLWKETFRKGWKIVGFRSGESKTWMKIQNPEGYFLEIKIEDFLEIMKNDTIVNGELSSEYKFDGKTLIKK